jgi:hypothetical protein
MSRSESPSKVRNAPTAVNKTPAVKMGSLLKVHGLILKHGYYNLQ